jgi:hypothetical protein
MKNAITPTIDGIPLALGDVLTGPACGPFSNGRIKGWSTCGRWVYVGWLGVIHVRYAAWCCDIEASKFARLYRPVKENRWESEAIAWGFAPADAIAGVLERVA